MTISRSVLYSYRRCPYAMRARMALEAEKIDCEIREIKLSDKPNTFTRLSPKATVPVLITPQGKVIEESLDIMMWVLNQSDSNQWLPLEGSQQQVWTKSIINKNDTQFKPLLDQYKYPQRYPLHSQNENFNEALEKFLLPLELLLQDQKYLIGDQLTLADVAIFPFIRQFAMVDLQRFNQNALEKLNQWLENILSTELYNQIMIKRSYWTE